MRLRLTRVIGLFFVLGVGSVCASPTLDGFDKSALGPGSFKGPSEGFKPLDKVGRFASEVSSIYSRQRVRITALEQIFSTLKARVAKDLLDRKTALKRIETWNIPAPVLPTLSKKSPSVVHSAKKMMQGLRSNRDQFYLIKRGDTLRAIARKFYGDTGMYRLLIQANNMSATSILYVGQKLRIPGGEGKTTPTRPKRRQRRIAVAYRPQKRMPLSRVVRAKPKPKVVPKRVYASVNQAKLAARSKIVPSENKLDYSAYEFKLYTVMKGDTLITIAKRFYGDPEKHKLIKSYNRIASAQSLKTGDRMLIPLPKSQETEKRYLLAKKGIFLDK